MAAKKKIELTPEQQEERLSERITYVSDVKKSVERLLSYLGDAESVETEHDFHANLDEALGEAQDILKELADIRHEKGDYE